MNLFEIWSQQKQSIDCVPKKFLFRERDIIFMRMGKNIGYEQNGKGDEFLRPVVVIRKFNRHLFWGVPLTTKLPPQSNPYYFSVGKVRLKPSWAILSQGRCFDIKRAKHKLKLLEIHKFERLKSEIQRVLFKAPSAKAEGGGPEGI